MVIECYLINPVLEDLARKMVFAGGSRQVGKTTFARESVTRHFKHAGYFNWDNREHRQTIMNNTRPVRADILISDKNAQDSLLTLLEFGGFPDPFIDQRSRSLRRWNNEKIEAPHIIRPARRIR